MLNPNYRDMLYAFSGENVEYLPVGAYALAAYGQVRATGDIVLWVKSNRDSARRVMTALARFGAPLHEVEARDFETPGIVVPDRRGAQADRHTDVHRRGGL